MGVYVIQKCAMSLDGYIGDTSGERLILSNPDDFERADMVRADCDAILVGANTIRFDDPRLTVKSSELRKLRDSRGVTEDPIKVTITTDGVLDPQKQFFTTGTANKIVYCPNTYVDVVSHNLGNLAEVVGNGSNLVDPKFIVNDLESRGVHKLLIEGGSIINNLFLENGLVDELQISIAPFFVGQGDAPQFVKPGKFFHNQFNRMELFNVEKVGDMALLIYRLKRK